MHQDTIDIIDLLCKSYEIGASDLHISVGSPPQIRVDGMLRKLDGRSIEREDSKSISELLLGPERTEQFRNLGEMDFSYEIEGCARFRINVFRQRGEISVAARSIPTVIPTIEQLGLPATLMQLVQKPQGLILVTGPTGSGKSSTLAAMIDHINRTYCKHIVTLEDPIEFLHSNSSSLIQQREIGSDTLSFSNGLRAALRQDPDVILVGEMRDAETISAAVTAAETGHLVFATLHTTDAPQTVDRIIDVFPGPQQQQIRTQLAAVLTAVISQRLFLRTGGQGRICATEIMINTPAIANLIRTEKTHQMMSMIQTGRELGMHTLETNLRDLIKSGVIDPASAKSYMTTGANN
ncbi:type IV pilus twitching motility protein PilT [Paenibacillus glacialis]|uniref:Type IV pili twitching motility protein PilT n=1 Tax=Paenibacillus glacialis TaxID=494026 RepID=A0A168L6Y2_9BACL|nr:type IV pilus twitching motility protein PilT [Paenibacillus glacialis]OAB42961.1 type IV pili twitching motility protein PilT [Paenibacillus glacialis]